MKKQHPFFNELTKTKKSSIKNTKTQLIILRNNQLRRYLSFTITRALKKGLNEKKDKTNNKKISQEEAQDL